MNSFTQFSTPLLKWYRKNRRSLPWRKTRDPYAIMVSEIMLQQTQVNTVIPYFERWMQRFPTLQELAQSSMEEVLKSWEGLGYYRRARFLHAAAQSIVLQHQGRFPKSTEDLSRLPGIGRYTLGAVSSIAFNYRMPILDGNVIRVLTRWFGIPENPQKKDTREKLWKIAGDLIPAKSSSHSKNSKEGKSEISPVAGDFNQSMMELGALICTPKNPNCSQCPIQRNCWAFKHNQQSNLPLLSKRPPIIRQYEYAGLIISKGAVLLQQRKDGRMENLWQFPSVTLPRAGSHWKSQWEKLFGKFNKAQPLGSIQYTVTHHQIRLELLKMEGFEAVKSPHHRWIKISKSHELPFTAAHRKLALQFLN